MYLLSTALRKSEAFFWVSIYSQAMAGDAQVPKVMPNLHST